MCKQVMNKKVLFVFILLFFTMGNLFSTVQIKSPDGNLVFKLGTDKNGTLLYSIKYRGQVVVKESPVVLFTSPLGELGKRVDILGWNLSSKDEHHEFFLGKNRYVDDVYNKAIVEVSSKSKENGVYFYHLHIRVYNEGCAFRIELPFHSNVKRLDIVREETHFRVVDVEKVYILKIGGFESAYEGNYEILEPGEIDEDVIICLPVLFKTNRNIWVAVTEADLFDYSNMFITRKNNEFVSTLAPLRRNNKHCAEISLPHLLPWRVFFIGDEPGRFIESDMIVNLSRGLEIENPGWIKPGKVAWPWWSGRVVDREDVKGGVNTETMLHYIDFASESGLEYLLIDAGWYGEPDDPDEDITRTIPEFDIKRIVKYANSKNVGILLWVNWGCVERQMKDAFPLYEKWGVKGVKIDYMNAADQDIVNFYWKVAKEAAKFHLVVDFHGAYKPTGLRRAYPNVLTREGVLGLEYCKWSKRCNPDHDVMIPYIRMLAGPMDYTPGAFNVVNNESEFKPRFTYPSVLGTRAHQLAMYVVYESPLQMVVDHPCSYLGQPGFEFIKKVPTVWDETKFIKGRVGEYIVIARKKGDNWYVGGMTNWKGREIELNLDFLEEGKYQAEMYLDSIESSQLSAKVRVDRKIVTNEDSIIIKMANGGGFAIIFSPTW